MNKVSTFLYPSGRATPKLPKPKQSNVERFYEWLIKCGNVHLADDEEIVKAFNKIPV